MHLDQVDLVTWHQRPELQKLQQSLSQEQWPSECHVCEHFESQGRGDSMRLNAESSYAHYQADDLTLEIRPGNVCNFACQTCWPEASSRVTDFYRKAGIDTTADWTAGDDAVIEIRQVKHQLDLDKIGAVLPRIRDIVVLGGEPFYDPACKRFLAWLVEQSCKSNLMIFTNGSCVDRELLAAYPGSVTMIFSLDAIGRPAEYIRYGTDWDTVYSNYLHCRALPNVAVRVNITTSVYNFHLVSELVEWLAKDWPEVVSFGAAHTVNNTWFMDESAILLQSRPAIITRLNSTIKNLEHADIEKYQRINAQNALASIRDNLEDMPFDAIKHQRMKDFIYQMDQAKHINIRDYLPEVSSYF
jgi:hypothetical protein